MAGREDLNADRCDMPAKVEDMMTREVCSLDLEMSALDAARAMRELNIGDVVVTDRGKVHGIVTDRDLVLRVMAEGKDPTVKLGDVCSDIPITLAPHDLVSNAVELMRSRSVRRLPVVENGRPVGIVTIGDLAIRKDPDSALADISRAAPTPH